MRRRSILACIATTGTLSGCVGGATEGDDEERPESVRCDIDESDDLTSSNGDDPRDKCVDPHPHPFCV